jgi:hypothetical protein
MRKFIAFVGHFFFSGGLLALAAGIILLLVHGIDVFGHEWSALKFRIAQLEEVQSGSFDRVVELERQSLAEERVLDLPEDGNQWHTVLILRPNWQSLPAERKAEAMFHSEPLLASLKHQTHWHLITSDQTEFGKFQPLVDVTPCLIVERANGQVVYRESGQRLGNNPRGLTLAIRKEIERHCPDRHCLPLHPVPDKDEPPSREQIPAVLQEETPEKEKPNLVPVAVVSALGALLGFARKFRHAAGM